MKAAGLIPCMAKSGIKQRLSQFGAVRAVLFCDVYVKLAEFANG